MTESLLQTITPPIKDAICSIVVFSSVSVFVSLQPGSQSVLPIAITFILITGCNIKRIQRNKVKHRRWKDTLEPAVTLQFSVDPQRCPSSAVHCVHFIKMYPPSHERLSCPCYKPQDTNSRGLSITEQQQRQQRAVSKAIYEDAWCDKQ